MKDVLSDGNLDRIEEMNFEFEYEIVEIVCVHQRLFDLKNMMDVRKMIKWEMEECREKMFVGHGGHFKNNEMS